MEIGNNILISPEVESVFGSLNVREQPPLEKNLFFSTTRYIAIKHASDIDEIKPLKVEFWTYDHTSLDNLIESCSSEKSNIYIYSVENDYEPPVFTKEGWVSLDSPPYPVANFLSKVSPTTIYVNNDIKKALVFVKRLSTQWIKEFCSSLFRIVPWIYSNNNLDENDKAFFKAIHDGDWTNLTKIINKIAEPFDFKTPFLKNMLSDWGNAYKKSHLDKLRKQEAQYRNYIVEYQNKLSNVYDDLYRTSEEINAFMLATTTTDDELFKFFKTHNQLSIISVNRTSDGNSLKYSIVETIEFYDQDIFNTYFNNEESYFYDDSINDDTRKIFFNIFSKEKGVFRTESVFCLHNLSSLTPLKEISPFSNHNTVPHPHLTSHACLGHNEDYIIKYLGNGNWELALEQSIAATKNVYFKDGAVMPGFLSWVQKNNNVRCIIADNGQEMTPSEFLIYVSEDK